MSDFQIIYVFKLKSNAGLEW